MHGFLALMELAVESGRQIIDRWIQNIMLQGDIALTENEAQ